MYLNRKITIALIVTLIVIGVICKRECNILIAMIWIYICSIEDRIEKIENNQD